MTRAEPAGGALVALLIVAGCLGGSPAASPSPDSPSSSATATTTTEPFWLEWEQPTVLDESGFYLTPSPIGGKTIHFVAGPITPEWAQDDDVTGRPAYVSIWNRTGLAHYSELWPKADRPVHHNVTVPPDPPYLITFYASASLVDFTGDAPRGYYLVARGVKGVYPNAPHDQVTDYLKSNGHCHTLTVKAGETRANSTGPILPSTAFQMYGGVKHTSDWGQLTVYDPKGRDNDHWSVDATGDVDPYYWGAVPLAGLWRIEFNLTLPAAMDTTWAVDHSSLTYWGEEVRSLGFDWPADYWDWAPHGGMPVGSCHAALGPPN